MTKTCCMFNYGPHYRDAIYSKMDKELNYDFYFGDKVPGQLKRIDVSTYTNYKKDLKNIFAGNMYWQQGAIQNIFKSYHNYILSGSLSNISAWLILVLAKLLGKKVYLWSHGWYGSESRFEIFAKKVFFGLSYKVLLYGDYAKLMMINHGFNEKNLITIYNSLDYDTQKKVRDQLTDNDVFASKFGNNYPTLCYVGRIQKSKQLELLIDAIILLKNQELFLNLIIIGEDSDNTGLSQYIVEHNLSNNVWLYGPSYNEEEIGTLIFNSNICVSPGNVGLTAIHSLMYGTPVITHSDIGYQGPEVEAIRDGINGRFFKKGDSRDLALKIYEWLVAHPVNNEFLREKCFKIIDEKYNPYYQIEVLRSVVGGG